MTGHELANKLLLMPDLTVTRRGYEGGVEEIKNIEYDIMSTVIVWLN